MSSRGRGRRGNCFNKQNHWHLRNKQSTSNDVGNQRPAGIMADRSKQEGSKGERKREQGGWQVASGDCCVAKAATKTIRHSFII